MSRFLSIATLISLVGLFLAGLRWNFGMAVPANPSGAYLVGVENGALHYSRSGVPLLQKSFHMGWERRWEPVIWWPKLVRSWVGTFVHVPFWIPAVLVAVWTGWAWRRRPFETGCAKCGYDVAGLRDGVCPECGEAIRAG